MSEEGSGSILAVGVLAAVLIFTGLALALSAGFAIRQQVEGAADAAALAAADTALGLTPGSPCAIAKRAASLNHAALDGCRMEGVVATVTATTSYLGFAITATARAGPPGSG
ncbi:MAG: Rv3654c family TadE-like protein [Microbacteriaceae bacterium]